jgi:hypothetical protein
LASWPQLNELTNSREEQQRLKCAVVLLTYFGKSKQILVFLCSCGEAFFVLAGFLHLFRKAVQFSGSYVFGQDDLLTLVVH